MRILVASDLHYRLAQYDWLVSQAPDVDVVALPGDHLDLGGAATLSAQVVVVAKYLERLAEHTVVVTSSGNHDLDGPGAGGEQVAHWLQRCRVPNVHVDGDTVDLGDVRFTVCPWWDGPETQAMAKALLERDAIDRPARWVWLYHAPPAGTGLCSTGRRSFPDPMLADWIEALTPDVVLCGHIHQAPWVDGGGWAAQLGRTWVFNAGRQAGDVPAHIVLDMAAGTADWFGVPDRDGVDLPWYQPSS